MVKTTLKTYKRSADVLLITGDGRFLVEDMDRFAQEFGDVQFEIMAVGRSPEAYEDTLLPIPLPLPHYTALDADTVWYVGKLLKEGSITHAHTTTDLIDERYFNMFWEIDDSEVEVDGNSALFAASVGVKLGFNKIVLAGCPLDDLGHWYDRNEKDNWPRWTPAARNRWQEFAAKHDGKVKSYSGITRDYFGMPTKEWFEKKNR